MSEVGSISDMLHANSVRLDDMKADGLTKALGVTALLGEAQNV